MQSQKFRDLLKENQRCLTQHNTYVFHKTYVKSVFHNLINQYHVIFKERNAKTIEYEITVKTVLIITTTILKNLQ